MLSAIFFLINSNSNEWIGFTGTISGSFIGAITGGLISFCIAKSQVKQVKNKEKIEEIKKFLKAYDVMNPILEEIISILNKPATDKQECYPLDLPKETLINHMSAHLSKEHDVKVGEGRDSKELAYHHLKKIIEIRDEMSEKQEVVINIKDEYILYEFYGEYQNIISTLNDIIKFIDKFLFHDNDVSKDEFENKLNLYHDVHGNNDAIQARLSESDKYSEFVRLMKDYHSKLDKLHSEKKNELNKLEK